jgi:hypothetical protein
MFPQRVTTTVPSFLFTSVSYITWTREVARSAEVLWLGGVIWFIGCFSGVVDGLHWNSIFWFIVNCFRSLDLRQHRWIAGKDDSRFWAWSEVRFVYWTGQTGITQEVLEVESLYVLHTHFVLSIAQLSTDGAIFLWTHTKSR